MNVQVIDVMLQKNKKIGTKIFSHEYCLTWDELLRIAITILLLGNGMGICGQAAGHHL